MTDDFFLGGCINKFNKFNSNCVIVIKLWQLNSQSNLDSWQEVFSTHDHNTPVLLVATEDVGH